MKIRDVMVHGVVSIEPSATLAEAAQLMREANVGILPVVDEGQVCGVITDRDLVVRAIANGADLTSTPVGACASGDPVLAHPDWNLEQAMDTMARAQVGRLPVIDDDNKSRGHGHPGIPGPAVEARQGDARHRQGGFAPLGESERFAPRVVDALEASRRRMKKRKR